jgi:uncharacterized protein YndB with AHSA1/START domain
MTRSISIDHDLKASPAQVWRTLTEPALLARWLMDNDIAPVVGHRFSFRTKPTPQWSGHVECEVLAVEPERLLRYSWRSEDLDTVVTWTLSPSPSGGTRLHLEHTGFTAANEMAFQGMSKGWQQMGDRIDAIWA